MMPNADLYSSMDPRIDQEADEIIRERGVDVHPLHRTWVFWFRNAVSKASKTESVARPLVGRIDSVEKFWVIFSGIEKIYAHYWYFMTNATSPKWEDPLNANGCRWIFEIKDLASAQAVFKNIVASTLGESLMKDDDEMSQINGVELQASPPKVKIWMSSVPEELRLGDDILQVLKQHGCGKPLRSANQTSSSRTTKRDAGARPVVKDQDGFTLVQNKKRGLSSTSSSLSSTAALLPLSSLSTSSSASLSTSSSPFMANLSAGRGRFAREDLPRPMKGPMRGSVRGSIRGGPRDSIRGGGRGRGETLTSSSSLLARTNSRWSVF